MQDSKANPAENKPKPKRLTIEIPQEMYQPMLQEFQRQRVLADGETINPGGITNQAKYFGEIFQQLIQKEVQQTQQKPAPAKKPKRNWFKIGFWIAAALAAFGLIAFWNKKRELALFER